MKNAYHDYYPEILMKSSAMCNYQKTHETAEIG